jgi:hypothetical protein
MCREVRLGTADGADFGRDFTDGMPRSVQHYGRLALRGAIVGLRYRCWNQAALEGIAGAALIGPED